MEGAKFHADKMRNIIFDFDAVIVMEEWMQEVKTEMGLKKVEEVFTNLRPAMVKKLLWFSLLADDPDLRLEEVGGIITAWCAHDGHYLEDLGSLLIEAVNNCVLFKKKKQLTGVMEKKKGKKGKRLKG